MVTVKTKDELASAINDNEIEIVIVNKELGRSVCRIKATGNVAWLVAAGAIGVAITSVLATAGTIGTVVAAPSFVAATASLGGISVATAAVGIGVAGGGIAVLNKLRNYKISEKSDGRVVLKR